MRALHHVVWTNRMIDSLPPHERDIFLRAANEVPAAYPSDADWDQKMIDGHTWLFGARPSTDGGDGGSVGNTSTGDHRDAYDDGWGESTDDPKTSELLDACGRHARFRYDQLGRKAQALEDIGVCSMCDKPHVVDCSSCSGFGRRYCAQHDLEVHIRAGGGGA